MENSALMMAIMSGALEECNALVKQGHNLTGKEKWAEAQLIREATSVDGNYEIFKLLIELGASVTKENLKYIEEEKFLKLLRDGRKRKDGQK